MEGEVAKKTHKKSYIIPHFYDVTWLVFEMICPVTYLLHTDTLIPIYKEKINFIIQVEKLRNTMLYELGLEKHNMDNSTAVHNKIKQIEKDFDLILLVER